MTGGVWGVSVVIPAHDEAASISRLLRSLSSSESQGGEDVEIIVVCNGCTDDTAAIARTFANVVVLEISEASKPLALRAGDAIARHPARAYVDADVELSRDGLLILVDALSDAVLATGPKRRVSLQASTRLVRWYYEVWELLPQVREGLFGRGVIVLSGRGNARVMGLPSVMSDDLAMSEVFTRSERLVVGDAEVVIRGPRTLGDLIRRRVRVATGNGQLDQLGMRSSASRTSLTDLAGIASRSPTLALKVILFLLVAGIARIEAIRRIRIGDLTWLRDESSRGDLS